MTPAIEEKVEEEEEEEDYAKKVSFMRSILISPQD